MEAMAHHAADASTVCSIPDLRGISLSDLAVRAGAGDDAIHGVIARTVGDQENPSLVPATIFNSAI